MENTIEKKNYGAEEEPIRELIRLCISTDRFHRSAVESRIRGLGIHRSQYQILLYLSKTETPPTQAEIAKAFEISPASVTVTLQKLEKAGLVERGPQSGNIRAKSIRITEAGRSLLTEAAASFAEIDVQMCRGISSEDRKVLMRCFRIMQQNLKAFTPEIESCGTEKKKEGEQR